MKRAAGIVAVAIVTLSWIAAAVAGAFTVYVGLHMVFAEHKTLVGLIVAVIVSGLVFELVQTIIGLCAVPFGLYAQSGSDGVEVF